MRPTRPLTALLAVIWLLHAAPAALAEPVETIVGNGPSTHRVDIVVMGDGYTASELAKYRSDVQAFVDALFAVEPFKEYRSYFNVHRVDVTSNQSGADIPEENVFRDTKLGALYTGEPSASTPNSGTPSLKRAFRLAYRTTLKSS